MLKCARIVGLTRSINAFKSSSDIQACRLSAWILQQKRFLQLEIPNPDEAYLHNPGIKPLLDTTVGKLVETAAERWPNRDCIVSPHQNQRLTFSQLLQRADRIAAGLKKIGLKKGNRIGIWGPNDLQWQLSYIASCRAGLVVASINASYQFAELDYCLNRIGARAVIAPESFGSQRYAEMLLAAKKTSPVLDHIILYTDNHVAGTRRLSVVENLPTRMEVEAVKEEQVEIAPWSGASIQFTYGTTGYPKAAFLSHKSIVNNAEQAMRRLELDGHKICLNLPFFHHLAMVFGIVGQLHVGTTLVLENPTFDPVKSVETIVSEKCDVIFGTPNMWAAMIDVQTRMGAEIDWLFAGVTGGAPTSPELYRTIRRCFRLDRLTTTFGLTETTAVTNQSLPGEDTQLTDTTVGCISDHLEVKVTDDNGKIVSFGTPGELHVRGYSVMMGYWGDEEATRSAISEDGWFKTSDQYILRKDGYGLVVGRSKEILVRGGINVFAEEIEHLLEGHPEIIEAHAFGVHDDIYGEEICACIRLSKDASLSVEDVRNHCQGKIAEFKIPRYILFRGDFPRSETGKVQKFKLKEELEREEIVPRKPVYQ